MKNQAPALSAAADLTTGVLETRLTEQVGHVGISGPARTPYKVAASIKWRNSDQLSKAHLDLKS